MKSKNLGDRLGQGRVLLHGGILGGILITENKTKLGKRWVAKQYKDGKLIASYPADSLSDLDLSFFEIQPGYQ